MATLGGSSGTDALLADIFILKLDENGNFIWVKRIGNNEKDLLSGLETDNSGNIIIGGDFAGLVDFDPGTAVHETESFHFPNQYISNFYLAKYDANGNFIWVKNIAIGKSYAMNSDNSGNINLTGTFGQTVDFDPDPSVNYDVTAVGGLALFIAQYTSDGNFNHVSVFNGVGQGDSRITSVYSDPFGNTYTTGFYQFTYDFDPGANLYELTSLIAFNGWETFLVKLNPGPLEIKETPSEINTFSIFPNPVDNSCKLISNDLNRKIKTLYIYNNQGIMIVNEIVNNYEYKLNTSEFLAGIYYAKIINDNNYIETKLIVKK